MLKKWIVIPAIGIGLLGSCAIAEPNKQDCNAPQPATAAATEVIDPNAADPNVIDPNSPLGLLLAKINIAAKNLKSCQAVVDYLFIQEPELLDSRTLRQGTLYYQKNNKGSVLRLNFDTTKQDDGESQVKKEHYLFDGVWLTKIDYTLRQIDQYQQSPADKPADVFEYISHNFPIVGFTGTDTLQKQFVVSLVPPKDDEKGQEHLLLKVKPNSVYKDDYSQIDLWIDSKLNLPVRMVSLSTQGDIYDLRLTKPELNTSLPEKTFALDAPGDFSKSVKTLEQNEETGKDSEWPQDL
jgi:outer membrane lipoprotein-sorting protein